MMRAISYATVLILSVLANEACSQTDSVVSSPHGLEPGARTFSTTRLGRILTAMSDALTCLSVALNLKGTSS